MSSTPTETTGAAGWSRGAVVGGVLIALLGLLATGISMVVFGRRARRVEYETRTPAGE